MDRKKLDVICGVKGFLRGPYFHFAIRYLLFAVSLLAVSPPLYSQSVTELGSEGDLIVLGTGGTALDPNAEIKGFTVFGSTQAAYTGAVAGNGNVVVNGALAVSSGAYFVGNSTFTTASKIFINDGSAGQLLSKNSGGWLEWFNASAIGDNLGNHVASTTLNMSGNSIVNAASGTFTQGITASSFTAANTTGAGLIVSSSAYLAVSGGNVGIGTAGPLAKLSVTGNIGQYSSYTTSAGTPVGSSLYLGDNNFYNSALYNSAPGLSAVYDPAQSVSSALAFYTYTGVANSRTECMKIMSNGNVGISTNAPEGRLDVKAAGSTQTNMAQIWRNSGGTIVSSASATGVIMAARFVGDGSGLTNLPASHAALTIAAIGATPNANGMTLTGQQLNLEPANASFGGVVTTGAQTFAGVKTFNSTISGNVSGTSGSTTGNAATATALASDPSDCSLPNVALGINAAGVAQCAQPSNVTGTASNITAYTVNQNVGTGNTPTFSGLSAGGYQITSVAAPIAATDAANKAYVDAAVAPRQYYLTPTAGNGTSPLTACAAGYHFASAYELSTQSVLKYNTSLGYNTPDSGYGPPTQTFWGWARTGDVSLSANSLTSPPNCLVWTSALSSNYGLRVAFSLDNTQATHITNMIFASNACNGFVRTWCMQD